MRNNLGANIEKILNLDLDHFQMQVDKVREINIEETLALLESRGVTQNQFYQSLSALRNVDFDEYQKALDAVKKMGLGITKDVPSVYEQMGDMDVSRKKSIFVSYSRKDSAHLKRLQVHLKPLSKKGLIHLWDDTKIRAGENWKQEISTAISDASIAVLLISADFLASDFIVDNELPPLLENASAGGTTILPVILKASRFEREESLSKFQAINSPQAPVSALSENEQESFWNKLAERVEELL